VSEIQSFESETIIRKTKTCMNQKKTCLFKEKEPRD